jgi:hypothetical protein
MKKLILIKVVVLVVLMALIFSLGSCASHCGNKAWRYKRNVQVKPKTIDYHFVGSYSPKMKLEI